MREIKFRAWDTVKMQIIPWEAMQGWAMSCFGNSRLMQFTGLYDKNGKEIYEGDILKDEGVVCFHDAAFQTKNYPMMNFFIQGMEDKKSKLEIIGNIHENPELLPDSTQGV